MNSKRSLSMLESKHRYQKAPLILPKVMTTKKLFRHNPKHQHWDDNRVRTLKPLEHLITLIEQKQIVPELMELANSVLKMLGNCTDFFMFDGFPSSHYQHIFRIRGKSLQQENHIINGGHFETVDALKEYEDSKNIVSVGFNSNNYIFNFFIEMEEEKIIGLLFVDQNFQKNRKQLFEE